MKSNNNDGRTQKNETMYDNLPFSSIKYKSQGVTSSTNTQPNNKFKQIKRNISLFSFMSNNVGLKETSTQTDLTMGDISRLEDIKYAHSSILYQHDLKNKKPFEAFSLTNKELYYPLAEKDEFLKKKTMRNPLHLQHGATGEQLGFPKKKFRSKNSIKGDIKIFNSVVVNNNDPNLNNKYYKNLIKTDTSSLNTPFGQEIYSSKVINFYNKSKENESEEEDDQFSNQSSEIGDMINQIRGRDDSSKKLLLKKKVQETLTSTTPVPHSVNISNFSNSLEKHDKRIHKKPRGARKEKPPSSLEIKDPSKEKSTESTDDGKIKTSKQKESLSKDTKDMDVLQNGLSLKEDDKETSVSQFKLKPFKKKYDPFNFYLEEFRQQNQNMKESEIEKEAKQQWVNLDKDTRKIYNMHADREKKQQKLKKKQSNVSMKSTATADLDDKDDLSESPLQNQDAA